VKERRKKWLKRSKNKKFSFQIRTILEKKVKILKIPITSKIRREKGLRTLGKKIKK